MKTSTLNTKQKGFTLIELIVVIVILGILAATALPKFADFGADARVASVRGANGALAATSAMAHGKWLVTTPVPGSVTFEGATITMNATSGYPVATAALATAAGINAVDYTITIAAGPPTTATISPVSAAVAATCRVVYTEPTVANTPPTIVMTTTGC